SADLHESFRENHYIPASVLLRPFHHCPLEKIELARHRLTVPAEKPTFDLFLPFAQTLRTLSIGSIYGKLPRTLPDSRVFNRLDAIDLRGGRQPVFDKRFLPRLAANAPATFQPSTSPILMLQ